MKENVRQIHQLEHQGQQLSKAVCLQLETGAYLTGSVTAADRARPAAVVSSLGAADMGGCERATELVGRSFAVMADMEKQSAGDLDGRMEQCLRVLQRALLDLTGRQ